MNDLNPSGLILLFAFGLVVLVTLAYNWIFKRKVTFDQVENFLVYLMVAGLVIVAIMQIVFN